MKQRISVLVAMFVLFFSYNASAIPELKLPFSGGETWQCTQGNNSCSDTSCTHRVGGKLAYALDFAKSECSGKPIIASASGTIVRSENSGDWGNAVIIDYGDGSYGLYAHLNNMDVNVGDSVIQGQKIGTCGTTGFSTGDHLHYQTQSGRFTYSQSIPSSFIDVSTNNGIP